VVGLQHGCPNGWPDAASNACETATQVYTKHHTTPQQMTSAMHLLIYDQMIRAAAVMQISSGKPQMSVSHMGL
jgi:hypothetical protein